jgi:hypothetical protein
MNCFSNACSTANWCSPHTLMQIAVGLFFSILFLQSGWDKIDDREGNITWMKVAFQKTAFGRFIPLLLSLLTVLELASGTFSLGGLVVLIWKGCSYWLYVGMLCSAATLLALFAGQRISKEYAGAASLVPYFILALIGIWLVG